MVTKKTNVFKPVILHLQNAGLFELLVCNQTNHKTLWLIVHGWNGSTTIINALYVKSKIIDSNQL